MLSNPTGKSELKPEVRHTLHRVRSLLRRYVGMLAILMIGCWLLLLFWLGGLIDYLPVTAGSNETPKWFRMGLLASMLLGSAAILLLWACPRWFAKIRDRSIALLIERHYPAINNQLVTAVELSEPARNEADSPAQAVSNPSAHREMLARVHESLAGTLASVDASSLFDWKPMWAAGICVLLSLGLTGFALVAMPNWMQLWSKRLFTLSAEPWPRRAELRADGVQIPLPAFTGQIAAERKTIPFVEGLARVPAGSAVLLQISAAATGKQVPDVCTMFYRTPDGSRGRANLRRIGTPRSGWQQFVIDGPPLDGISQDMSLDIVGLDARLRNLQLQTVTPVVITKVDLEITYPNYLLESLTRPSQETLAYRSGLQIPQGSQVRISGQASANLQDVQFVHEGPTSDNSAVLAVQHTQPEDKQFSIELGVLQSSQVIEVRLIDEHGLSSERIPRYLLAMQVDAEPEVSSQFLGIGNAITPEAILPIRGTVTDDHAVARVTAELVRSDDAKTSLDLPMPEETALEADIDLQTLKEQGGFSLSPGDTLGLVITASDFFDLDGQTHTGKGQPKQLSVVTADELLILLDRQELELRQRLEVIIAELEQVRETLASLTETEAAAAVVPFSKPWFVAAQTPFQDSEQPQGSDDQTASNEQTQRTRMTVLRAQQCILQSDKSEQELTGVAANIDNLRMQLQNNRIDSYDRQQRLQSKVCEPLLDVLASEYPDFGKDLMELQTAAMSGDATGKALQASRSLNAVLLKLVTIKENMLDIESFNEIIDLVRGLLEEQDILLERTEQTQRERILNLLQ